MQESLIKLFEWLRKRELTIQGRKYEIEYLNDDMSEFLTDTISLGLSVNRSSKRTEAELKTISEKHRKLFSQSFTDKDSFDKIYDELQKLKNIVRFIDINKINPDALAFYRPFHVEPFDQWGVYLLVDRIVDYFYTIRHELRKFYVFTDELIMTYILFEIFHHEFFHHIVESTATTIEFVEEALGGEEVPIYLQYLSTVLEQKSEEKDYKLEESLANAYAYNSVSFINIHRKGPSLKGTAYIYQEMMKNNWHKEPPGYRDAGKYIKGHHLNGAAKLLDLILAPPFIPSDMPFELIAQKVFPRGHTAFVAKPDIPCYLIGKSDALEFLYRLVPAPNESYTTLYWPGDTKELDEYIKKRKKEEKTRKNESLFQ